MPKERRALGERRVLERVGWTTVPISGDNGVGDFGRRETNGGGQTQHYCIIPRSDGSEGSSAATFHCFSQSYSSYAVNCRPSLDGNEGVTMLNIPCCLLPTLSRCFTPFPTVHQPPTMTKNIPTRLACSIQTPPPEAVETPSMFPTTILLLHHRYHWPCRWPWGEQRRREM